MLSLKIRMLETTRNHEKDSTYDQMIHGGKYDLRLLKLSLQLRKHSGKTTTRKSARPGIQPGPIGWEESNVTSRLQRWPHYAINIICSREQYKVFFCFNFFLNYSPIYYLKSLLLHGSEDMLHKDHRCGIGVTSLLLTQRARVRSPVEVFSGVFLNGKTNVRKIRPHSSPVIIWPPYIIRLRTASDSDHSCSTWSSLNNNQQHVA